MTASTTCTAVLESSSSFGDGPGAGVGAGGGGAHPHPVKLYLVPDLGADSNLQASTGGLCLAPHCWTLAHSKQACWSGSGPSAQPQPLARAEHSASAEASEQASSLLCTSTTCSAVRRSMEAKAADSDEPARASGLESRDAQGAGSTVSLTASGHSSGAPSKVLTRCSETSRREQPSTKRTFSLAQSTCEGSCAVASPRAPSEPSPPGITISPSSSSALPSADRCSLTTVRL
mmetsp:Transcript_95149/g.252719  ORF Transcript_95149/g.252719 Transcript_95149/m.252719 type:complete len:232 (-) Transcript_95149:568-1263(-)